MSIKEKVARNLSMLYSVFKTEGLMPGAECWVRQVGAKLLGMSDAGHPRTNVFLFHLTDCLYDSIHGTNTGGVIDLPEMEGNGRNYVGTPPRAWKLLLRHLPIDSSRFTYFDLGCGKGRTLLLASAVGFKRVIGVDISSQLLSIARSNLKRKGMDGELICADVRTVEFPCDPLVVFMYNPSTKMSCGRWRRISGSRFVAIRGKRMFSTTVLPLRMHGKCRVSRSCSRAMRTTLTM